VAFEFRDMTPDEIDEFLKAPRHAIVGTNRRDGPPQLSPVWYLYENGRFYFSVYANSAKCRNLRRDPRISLCIAGDSPDARAVMVYGTAELLTSGGQAWMEEIEGKIFSRYQGDEGEAQPDQDTADDGREAALVVVTADKVIAQDYN